MEYKRIKYSEYSVDVAMSAFQPEEGVKEYNVMLRGIDPTASLTRQVDNLHQALSAVKAILPGDATPVFMRYFLSDPANQAEYIPKDMDCAVSIIGQAPLDGTKVALWVYFQTRMKTSRAEDGMHAVSHGKFEHIWLAGATSAVSTSLASTVDVLGEYSAKLAKLGCTLEENCQRTWFFVRDVDVNYPGVVQGRNRIFDFEGLTTETHFIASTGISGSNAIPSVSVTMDAYAIKGIDNLQITYLKAPDYLNPTAEYGVAFERGTAICYGDRRHVIISGTASINNKGEVMYPGDIRMQTKRMLQNVEALVTEGQSSMHDLTHMIIYLRDIADYEVVREMFESDYPDTPKVIVLAPVCRPGWLIEVECMSISANGNPEFAEL